MRSEGTEAPCSIPLKGDDRAVALLSIQRPLSASKRFVIWLSKRRDIQPATGVRISRIFKGFHSAINHLKQVHKSKPRDRQDQVLNELVVYDPDKTLSLSEMGDLSVVRDPHMTYASWLSSLDPGDISASSVTLLPAHASVPLPKDNEESSGSSKSESAVSPNEVTQPHPVSVSALENKESEGEESGSELEPDPLVTMATSPRGTQDFT